MYNGRNRTFFFVSVQKESVKNPATYLARTLTDAEKNGDFSSTLNSRGTALQIYDPYSTVVTAGKATRQPFPGAKIPTSRFNAVGAAIASQYPSPTVQGTPQLGVNNWADTTSLDQPSTNVSVRIDQTIGARQRLYGRFGLMRYDNSVSGLPRGFELQEGEWRHFYSASLNDDFTFGPTFLGTFRYSFGRYLNNATWSSLGQDPAELKLPDVLTRNALYKAWPRIRMGDGLMGLGGRVKYRVNDTQSLVPSFTKLVGNHAIRFGADLRLLNWNSIELGLQHDGRVHVQ